MDKLHPLNPTSKRPQTRPQSSSKRTRRTKNLGVIMPHKGSARGRKPTLGQQYPQQ